MKKLSEAERVARRLMMLDHLIGIPIFEFKTPNNKYIVQPVLIDVIPSDEYTGRNSWIDRQIRFYEKLDRMFLGWEIKKNLRDNQGNFDETLASSESTSEQMVMAHKRNISAQIRNGKRPIGARVINWEDESPPNTMYFAETCSQPRQQFWWLARLSVKDRANVDHHIALEIERGEWD